MKQSSPDFRADLSCMDGGFARPVLILLKPFLIAGGGKGWGAGAPTTPRPKVSSPRRGPRSPGGKLVSIPLGIPMDSNISLAIRLSTVSQTWGFPRPGWGEKGGERARGDGSPAKVYTPPPRRTRSPGGSNENIRIKERNRLDFRRIAEIVVLGEGLHTERLHTQTSTYILNLHIGVAPV